MKGVHQLVLLRGLARESRHWGSFIQDLEKSYAEQGITCRIETIDFPGCGRHSEMLAMPSIAQMTEFAREKMKDILVKETELGLAPATHRRLVAISLGGMVAADWVSRFPSDFHSLVLINSSFRGLSKAHDRLRWESWWRLPAFFANRTVEKREAGILDWVSNRADRRREVLADWVKIQHSRPVSVFNISVQLAAAARFKAPEKIPVPLLVLASRQDRMVDPACSKAIAEKYLQNGEGILFHPTAGHDLTLDAGAWVGNMIAEWQTQQSSQKEASV
jgi:pimeloyl-ACP methyl ester carboxylesterase